MSESQDKHTADKLFKQHFNQVHLTTARYVGIAVLAILALFAGWDIHSLGTNHPALAEVLLIRFSLTLPVILLTILSTFKKNCIFPQDILVTFTCIITSVSIIVLHWKFYQLGNELKLDSIMLCLIAIYFLPNIFSSQKILAGSIIMLCYFGFLSSTNYKFDYYIQSAIYLLSINIAGLIHSNHFDKQRRIVFDKTEFLKKLALTDQLTGADNRHKFDEHFVELLEQGKEEQKGIAIAIADIDFFKQFNDTYGHFAGDECLIKVAQTFLAMKQHPLDRCIRFGGEEFILIKYDVSLNESLEWGQSIIDTIYQLNIPHSSSTAESRVTISAGVIHWSPNSSLTRTELMKQADEALYQAKNNGRNQVHFCNPS